MGANSSHNGGALSVGCFPKKGASCDAYGSNAIGSSRSSKKGKPPPPPERAPVVVELTLDSVTLSWKRPGDRSSHSSGVFAYTVEKMTSTNLRWDVVPGACQSTTFTGRLPDPRLTYSFRVRAENVHGIGKPSPPSRPVCPEHALSSLLLQRRSDCAETLVRSASVDAATRFNVKAPNLTSACLGDATLPRNWRSMSLRCQQNPVQRSSFAPTTFRRGDKTRASFAIVRPYVANRRVSEPSQQQQQTATRQFNAARKRDSFPASDNAPPIAFRNINQSAANPDSNRDSIPAECLDRPKSAVSKSPISKSPEADSADECIATGASTSLGNDGASGENRANDAVDIFPPPQPATQNFEGESNTSVSRVTAPSPLGYRVEVPRRPTSFSPSKMRLLRESIGEIDMAALDEINNLDLALRRSYHSSRHLTATLSTLDTDGPTGMDRTLSALPKLPVPKSLEFFHTDRRRVDNFGEQSPGDELPTPPDDRQTAGDWLEDIWSKLSSSSPVSQSATRIISNTLTCDWDSLSDSSGDDDAPPLRYGSEESLTKRLGEEMSEVDSSYEFS